MGQGSHLAHCMRISKFRELTKEDYQEIIDIWLNADGTKSKKRRISSVLGKKWVIYINLAVTLKTIFDIPAFLAGISKIVFNVTAKLIYMAYMIAWFRFFCKYAVTDMDCVPFHLHLFIGLSVTKSFWLQSWNYFSCSVTISTYNEACRVWKRVWFIRYLSTFEPVI